MKKRTDKLLDNVETKKLIPLLKEFMEKIEIGFDAFHSREEMISELEYISRDGFSSYNHNRGGVDFIAITTDRELIGSGTHIGTSIENRVNDSYDAAVKQIKEDHPSLAEDSEEFYNLVDSITGDDYSGQAFRVRVMYEGDNTISVFAGWDFDASYFRWSNKAELDKTIKFKNKRDLKTKLNKLLVKINKLA